MRSQTTKHLAVPGPDFAHLLQSFFQTSNWVRGLTRWAFANASVRSNCYSNSFRLNRPAQRAALPRRPKFSPSHAKNETETRRNWEREGRKRIDEMQFVAFFSSHPLIQMRFIFNRRLFEDGKKIVPSFFPSSFLIYSLFLAFHSDLNIFTSYREFPTSRYPSPLPQSFIRSLPLFDSRFSELVK